MASIKAIEHRSVHQIQSGQVIVDLNSVVKELVENSLDAGATSIEVRFRNHGLDAIEVVDNGAGIAPDDYACVALKHHTSKLSRYEDLEGLHTFGFRGEALASLCALSQLHIITARDVDVPKGRKLEFESSGKLKNTSIVAAQKGTKVVVEKLFFNLPVRKKELEKNIKREYGKVLTLLQAYACISTGVRFVVSNQMPKGSKNVAFSTAINSTTRDNITNVFGAKTLHALVKLDLKLEMQPSKPGFATQAARITGIQQDTASKEVIVQGHISQPVFGEGRSAPDRQFLFVNSRPCGLPQVAKAFNEVYRTFNVSQSPFVFANLVMDTSAYDVNVSPDKRTILLHDQHALLESLKEALLELFDAQEQSVPQAKLSTVTQAKLPAYKPLTMMREEEEEEVGMETETDSGAAEMSHSIDAVQHMPVICPTNDGISIEASYPSQRGPPERLIHSWVGRSAVDRDMTAATSRPKQQTAPVQNAFDRMRPPRTPSQVAHITIGDKTTRTIIGSASSTFKRRRIHTPKIQPTAGLRAFAMPGSQMELDEEADESDEVEDETGNEEDADATELQALSPHEGRVDTDEDYGEGEENDISEDEGMHRSPSAGLQNDLSQGTSVFDVQRKEWPVPPPFLEESTEESDIGSDKGSEDGDGTARTRQCTQSPPLDSDDVYRDEVDKKSHEDEKIARLIRKAEEAAAVPSADHIRRANQAMKGTVGSKHSVLNLASSLHALTEGIQQQVRLLADFSQSTGPPKNSENTKVADDMDCADAETRLSLTVSKPDFARMAIAGQFNLGFIIALRPDETGGDDLFIIDQHAADEKFNFERLSRTLNLEPQRLAQPKQLHLTAIEEEIILAHSEALASNGFVIETDTSGNAPVGERCKLCCLPMSKETTFDLTDLEELIHLLSEHSVGGSASNIPRPSKVRKMLAMRACRSSIMVGKTLNNTQMQKVVRNLGEMDKPWNCPHGRPTMRHLAGMGGWQGWDDIPEYERGDGELGGGHTNWSAWLAKKSEAQEEHAA